MRLGICLRWFLHAMLCLSLPFVYGQSKLGYANVEYILSQLPEAKQVQSELETYEGQLKRRMESKVEEYKRKGENFEKNYNNMTDLERADTQEEIQTIQESILKFQQEAEASIQQKQQNLLKPLYEKIQSAIDSVASRNNYTYIFKAESLLFAKPEEDISDDILKLLGVTPEPPSEGE